MILLIHKDGMSFHLLMFSLSLYRSVTSFVKFILRYFNFFEAVVNGIVFQISFLDCSLFMYRNATFLCIDFVSCYFGEHVYDI
jgi:hypothetical protein